MPAICASPLPRPRARDFERRHFVGLLPESPTPCRSPVLSRASFDILAPLMANAVTASHLHFPSSSFMPRSLKFRVASLFRFHYRDSRSDDCRLWSMRFSGDASASASDASFISHEYRHRVCYMTLMPGDAHVASNGEFLFATRVDGVRPADELGAEQR